MANLLCELAGFDLPYPIFVREQCVDIDPPQVRTSLGNILRIGEWPNELQSAVGDNKAAQVHRSVGTTLPTQERVVDPLKKIVGSEALASAQEVVAKARNLANKLAKEADSQARARQNKLANLDIGLMCSPSLGTIQLTRKLL